MCPYLRLGLALIVLLAPLATQATVLFGADGKRLPEANEANVADWPTSLVLVGATRCGATIVGPRVVLTAASCIADGSIGTLRLDGVSIDVECRHAAAYANDKSADFALCSAHEQIPGGFYQRIDFDPARMAAGAQVILSGHGCQYPGGVDGSFGALGVGSAMVSSAASGDASMLVIGGVALCSGDAGSGAYSLREDGSRVLIGVGSRSDGVQRSWIAAIASPAFLGWARPWARARGVAVCGLEPDGTGCQLVPEDENQVAAPPASNAESVFTLARPETTKLESGIAIAARAGETVRDAITRACGAQSDAFFAALAASYLSETGDAITPNMEFSAAQTLRVPVCSPTFVESEKVQVEKGDTAWTLFQRTRARLERAGYPVAWSAATGAPNEIVFLDELAAKNDNVSKSRNYRLEPNSQVSIPTVAESQSVAGMSVEPVFALSAAELQSSSRTCKSVPADPRRHPYDLEALLEALAANGDYSRRGDESHALFTTVLVADSGLLGAGTGIFRKSALARDRKATDFAGIIPISGSRKVEHGTQVASLILGGPLMARFQTLRELRIIKLAVTRLYSKVVREARTSQGLEAVEIVDVEPTTFAALVDRARNGSLIVNLSVKTATPIPDIKAALGPNENVLFVVAAGNDDGDLDTPGTQVFPAEYGGDDQSNLLSVGSVEPDKTKAPFSNWGSKSIDIATEGCEIPVVSYDVAGSHFVLQSSNGTSLSAAIVSFAAALVKAESPDMTPREIKRRILSSATLNSAESKHVRDGRTLDIVKAVSMHEDLVQWNAPSGLKESRGRVFLTYEGQVQVREKAIQVCSDATFSAIKLLKLVPHYRTQDGVALAKIYYLDEQQEQRSKPFESAECVLSAGFGLAIKEDDAANVASMLDMADVVDVVMAN